MEVQYWVKTKPNCIVIYKTYQVEKTTTNPAPLLHSHFPGKLSLNASRKLKTALRWMVAAATPKMVFEKKHKGMVPWKINLGTLTFKENMQDDNRARRILSSWLEVAKYRWGVNSYVWKAEPQHRGAIHFHFSTDVYIPHAELRYTWNRALHKDGLGTMKSNSTDVHAVVNVGNLEAYLSEYMLNDEKHAGRRDITGRLWGCSQNLTMVNRDAVPILEQHVANLQEQLSEFDLRRQLVSAGKDIPEWLLHCDYFAVPEGFYSQLSDCSLKEQYMNAIATLQPIKKPDLFGVRE